MSLPETIQHIYEDLARRYERRNDLRLRDAFLLLAADVAHDAGRPEEAERLRIRMLEVNPNSLLRPFPTFPAALGSLDIQDYLADLRKQFPPEEAERLLHQVRSNPLGMPQEGKRVPMQHETQEVIPPTARTINMPANQPPRKSPYENYTVPPPERFDVVVLHALPGGSGDGVVDICAAAVGSGVTGAAWGDGAKPPSGVAFAID